MKYVWLLYYEFKKGADQDTILIAAYDSEEKAILAQHKREQDCDSAWVTFFYECVRVL